MRLKNNQACLSQSDSPQDWYNTTDRTVQSFPDVPNSLINIPNPKTFITTRLFLSSKKRTKNPARERAFETAFLSKQKNELALKSSLTPRFRLVIRSVLDSPNLTLSHTSSNGAFLSGEVLYPRTDTSASLAQLAIRSNWNTAVKHLACLFQFRDSARHFRRKTKQNNNNNNKTHNKPPVQTENPTAFALEHANEYLSTCFRRVQQLHRHTARSALFQWRVHVDKAIKVRNGPEWWWWW